MRYYPLIITRCCLLAAKFHEKGYESIWNILPIPYWRTVKQYRETTSSEPINKKHFKKNGVRNGKKRTAKEFGAYTGMK